MPNRLGRSIGFAALICLAFTTAGFCQIKAGDSAITVSPSSLMANGKSVSEIDAGQTVIILGLKNDTQQAIVSYTSPAGVKSVGALPLANLISVDDGSINAAAPVTAVAQTVPAAALTPLPDLDLTKLLTALEIATFFKTDKARAKQLMEGKIMTFNGIIERMAVENPNGGLGEVPIITLRTGIGLPRVKVRISSTVGNSAFFRQYNNYLGYGWWGYSGRVINFRMNGSTELQIRGSYKYGSSSRDVSTTAWFPLVKVGESVTIEANCKGLYMDVEFEAGQFIGTR